LGWEPRVPLDEGLARTIEYFSSLLAGSAVDLARSPGEA
jgi:hypothetical protein